MGNALIIRATSEIEEAHDLPGDVLGQLRWLRAKIGCETVTWIDLADGLGMWLDGEADGKDLPANLLAIMMKKARDRHERVGWIGGTAVITSHRGADALGLDPQQAAELRAMAADAAAYLALD